MDFRISKIIYEVIIAALCLLITIKIHFENIHNIAAWNSTFSASLENENRILRSRISDLEGYDQYLESRISDLETEVYY